MAEAVIFAMLQMRQNAFNDAAVRELSWVAYESGEHTGQSLSGKTQARYVHYYNKATRSFSFVFTNLWAANCA